MRQACLYNLLVNFEDFNHFNLYLDEFIIITLAHVQLICAIQCAATAASSIKVALLVALAARSNAGSTAISMASGYLSS